MYSCHLYKGPSISGQVTKWKCKCLLQCLWHASKRRTYVLTQWGVLLCNTSVSFIQKKHLLESMAAERKQAVLKTHCALSLFTYFINPHLAWLSEHGCRIQIQKLYLPHAFPQWIHSKCLWRTYLAGLWTTTRKSILPRHTLYLACRYKMTPQFKNMYSAERKGVLEFRIWELGAWLVWLPNLNMRTLHN